MNKYILFVWDKFYPSGGWNDYYGVYTEYDDALFAGIRAIQNGKDHFQIVYRDTLAVLITK